MRSPLIDHMPCPHLKLLSDGELGCELHDSPNYPNGCKEFPTVEHFLSGEVPRCCGYRLEIRK